MRNIEATGTIFGETITVKQISKIAAEKLFNNGETIYMQTSNYYPFGVWQNLMTANNSSDEGKEFISFETLCNFFMSYNCDNKRGKYIHFYKKIS